MTNEPCFATCATRCIAECNLGDLEPATGIVEGTYEFMRRADQLAPTPPTTLPEGDTRLFRVGLLAGPNGEVNEYLDAEAADDPVGILDGLVDSIVVELGTAIRYFGLEVTVAALGIVADANLAKLTGPEGVVKDATGKVCKPAGWAEAHDPNPRLAVLLESHGWNLGGGK